MPKVIEIPGYQTLRFKGTIRPLFENTGIPGYFVIAEEIPSYLLDMEMPEENYHLVLRERKASRLDLRLKHLAFPSIQQVLWAIGFMNLDLAGAIGERPTRFLHEPFRVDKWHSKGKKAWRQIFVRRTRTGYSVGTVAITNRSPNSFKGYLLPI